MMARNDGYDHLRPMNGDNGRPLANNACEQGSHGTCDQMAGGMVAGVFRAGGPVPCECPHHAEARA